MNKKTIEQLNSDLIKSLLTSDTVSRVEELYLLDSLESTNSFLLQKAKVGAKSGHVCFSEQQTAGRGRRGRQWYSPYGVNIYCSVLWVFPKETCQLSPLSLSVAVMVAHVLEQLGAISSIQLKWPNDIYAHGRKCSGILLESISTHAEERVVIGIGINIGHYPTEDPNMDPQWISLSALLKRQVSRNQAAGLLTNALLTHLPIFEANGFSAFKKAWDHLDYLQGKQISVDRAGKTTDGIMEGVNHQGELLLRDSNNIVHFFNQVEGIIVK